jgi:GT2 family glycosyltransferase
MERKVSIVCPIAESVPPKVFRDTMAMISYTIKNGVEILDIGITERELIDEARNNLATTFLATPTEWLFWMDADMVLPKETIVELFKVAEEKNAKIVTGIYYQRKGQNLPVLWSRGVETETTGLSGMGSPKAKVNKYCGSYMFPHPDKKEPFKVHAAGFGCVLVHRSVFESLDYPWFKFIKGQCSEDFYFFVNAKEAGFEAWAVPSLKLGHIADAPVITKDNFYKNAFDHNIDIDGLKSNG